MPDVNEVTDDRKADLNAAFDALEKTSEPAPEPVSMPEPQGVEPSPPPIGTQPEPTSDRPRDEHGRFAPKPKDAEGVPPKPLEAAPKAQEPTPKAQEPAPFKAPQSWRAHIRELAQKLPPEFRPIVEESLRRDRETEGALREAAEARQITQRLRETLAPFEGVLRAAGADPFQTFQTMMRANMVLTNGSQMDKVNLIANAIVQNGVDLQMLANRLEGQQNLQPSQPDPSQYRDPRVDTLLSQVEQAKMQRQERLAAEARSMIEEIQGEEFFNDVRDVMADILDTAARRGVAMTPREAYNRAVWADPHVAEVLQQRQVAQQARNSPGSTARAVAAASSIKGSPAVAAGATQPGGRREDIEAAWDALQDRR